MSDGLKQVQKALGRGDADEALVLLWNALEPVRIAGDRGALRTIEQLATQIARAGDEAQQREAKRLLEALGVSVPQDEPVRPATARVEAEVEAEVGAEVERGREEVETEEATPEAEAPRGVRLGPIIWFLALLGFVLFNLLSEGRG